MVITIEPAAVMDDGLYCAEQVVVVGDDATGPVARAGRARDDLTAAVARRLRAAPATPGRACRGAR